MADFTPDPDDYRDKIWFRLFMWLIVPGLFLAVWAILALLVDWRMR